jgi:hypothetical protein
MRGLDPADPWFARLRDAYTYFPKVMRRFVETIP